MKNALTYLTRGCPRACEYCSLRDAQGIGANLPSFKWCEAFAILKEIGVDFNLILGNETWLLGKSLIPIMSSNKVPYAIYTTCPEPLFTNYRDLFYENKILDNLSCGMDYPVTVEVQDIWDDSYKKSLDAWKGFTWIKERFPEVDTQGTITVHKKNLRYVPQLVKDLSELGVFIGINFIHWNRWEQFDFFPKKEDIQELLFTEPWELKQVESVMKEVLAIPNHLIQNPEFISQPAEMLCNMGWHCKGNPYGGPTIDSDGHLRCCGYRRGVHTPRMTIFDLPEHLDMWKELVYNDAMECPGCAWSYPWMFHYWEQNPELGKLVFSKHAGKHIPEEKWSKRNINT